MAAAEAADSAMPRVPAISASSGGRCGVASSVPTTAVSMINATTRGLVNSR